MTRKTTRMLACAGLLFVLAACGHSPPTRYFSLEAVPPSAPLGTVSPPIAPVQLGAVRVPALLDRPEVVAQQAGYRLTVRENDRWGAPFAQMVRSTLARDLVARLPPGSFILPGVSSPAGVRRILVPVLDLRASANGQMTFEGSWALVAGERSTAVMTQEISLTEPMASADSAQIADTLSRLLGRLADRIAASLVSPQPP